MSNTYIIHLRLKYFDWIGGEVGWMLLCGAHQMAILKVFLLDMQRLASFAHWIWLFLFALRIVSVFSLERMSYLCTALFSSSINEGFFFSSIACFLLTTNSLFYNQSNNFTASLIPFMLLLLVISYSWCCLCCCGL